MRVLIIGGTRFLGAHLAAAARARQHELTLFHRGTEATPERGVEVIRGDRDHDLDKLHGRRWDAVIDTCGYLPQSVSAAARALATATPQYVFISSISAYADLSGPSTGEDAPLVQLTDDALREASAVDRSGPVSATTYGSSYGGLKASCEAAARQVFGERLLIVRPGLIVGPDDYTDRFTYWVARVARGGEVLAPGRGERSVQFIDVCDLAEWVIALIERRQCGVFNATGPPQDVTMGQLLERCAAVSDSDAFFTWVSETFLLREQVRPWTEMPLWLPEETTTHMAGLMAVDNRRAVAAGLRYRPLGDTIGAVLRWFRRDETERPLRAGLTADREQRLLAKWHGRPGRQR
jgi:2'-hydroxyisoflavone reductase